MMNAAVYHSFGGPIRVEKVPRPTSPSADDAVVVQVKASGVCRSDWHGWKGHDGDIIKHGLPFVPGHEASGIVVAVGRGVRNCVIGDRVAIPFILSCGRCRCCQQQRPTVCMNQEQPGFTRFGSFAEYLDVPRADRNLHKLPASVSFVQAAALGCRFTTAYRAVLQQGRLRRGESVAIFGCGGLGLSCVMIAALHGASPIIVVDINREALQRAQELGAHHIVQQGRDATEARKAVMLLTEDEEGADLTIDAAGFKESCENAVWCTRRAGRMVQVGLPIGGGEENDKNGSHSSQLSPVVPMAHVAAREIEIIGSHGFAADDLPHLLQLVSEKKLDPTKMVGRCVSLQEGARAIEQMDHGSPAGITMITRFSDEPSVPSRL